MFAERIKPYRTALLFLTAMVVLVVGYTYRLDSRKSIPAELEGVMRPDARALESLALKDQNNRAFHREDFAGKWSFVFFGYTYCPDICPMTLAALVGVNNQLQSQADRAADYRVIFVSVDPERDTPEVLVRYLEYFDKQFIGLTGSKEQIDAVTRQFGAGYIKEPERTPGEYLISHTSSIFLIDPEARLTASFSPPHDPATIARQFKKIQEIYR